MVAKLLETCALHVVGNVGDKLAECGQAEVLEMLWVWVHLDGNKHPAQAAPPPPPTFSFSNPLLLLLLQLVQ